MKKFAIILSIFVTVALASCKKTEPTPTPEPEPEPEPKKEMPAEDGSGEKDGYKVVWQDLFDDGVLSSDWNIEVNGDGGGNNELQYYRKENVTIETDESTLRRCLVLTAKKQNYLGKACTSGRLNTNNKVSYQYGKVEAMIKLPKTYKGLWPAFWMMGDDIDSYGWPKCGELDILEMGNSGGFQMPIKAEKFMNGALHGGTAWDHCSHSAYSVTYPYSVQDGEFHLVTCIWTKTSIKCYIDLDKFPNADPYYEFEDLDVNMDDESSITHYFHKPFFIIFDLAIGGNFPGLYDINEISALNADNNYEAKMYIDYVKVYQK